VSRFSRHLTRAVLLAPAAVARAAAAQAADPREGWMLRQRRAVRRSYVRQVLDKGDDERRAEAWMLRQPKAIRESYVREVLDL
jgi:hypothetical protein